MATPELLAAVTAAVKGEEPPAAPAPVVDPPADEASAADPAKPEDLVGTPPAEGETPPTAATEPQMDEQGRVRGPDGKFVAAPKAADPAAQKPAEPAAPAAAAPAAPAKPADPLNDPIPPTAKPDTRERMQTLVGMVKERDTELTTVKGDLELIMAPIQDANATVEQFQESMKLLKNINSPHQHEQMQALEYLQGAAAMLAAQLGQVPPGTDPLSGNNDLIQRVNAGTLTRADAEEIAQARRAQASTQQFQRQTQQRSQQTQEQQRAVQAGQAAVREVEEGFKAVDPSYDKKVAVMRTDAAFVNQLRTMPPHQWAAAFAQKYRSINLPAAAPAAAPAAGGNGKPATPTPLRAKSPAGGTAKPPSTQLEAVSAAISRVRAG